MSDPRSGPVAGPLPDRFAADAGAYLLGALDAAERLAFEEHLGACPACRSAVAELAHLPGLLATVPAEGLADPPASVLVGLLSAVGRGDAVAAGGGAAAEGGGAAAGRRSRWRRVAGAVALVGAAAAGFVAAAAVLPGRDAPPGPQAEVTTVALDAVVATPVVAAVELEPTDWGTRLSVTCTYRGDDPYAGTGGAAQLALVVHDADGGREQVATWTAVTGREVTVPSGTALPLAEITRVDMVSDGEVVLTATL